MKNHTRRSLESSRARHVCPSGILFAIWFATTAFASTSVSSDVVEDTFVIQDFEFESGESLDELRIHYHTIGAPHRNADGEITNAILLLHGSFSSGKATYLADDWLPLYAAGGILDVSKYYIIMPDAIGHGASSKPSDGLRMKFPRYTYTDMVAAQKRLLVDHLKVNHLKLVLGISMGGMHTWLWATQHPDFMDGAFPLVSQPGPMSGRNWMSRAVRVQLIKNDPAWQDGNYTTQPPALSLTDPIDFMFISSARHIQDLAPTREKTDELIASIEKKAEKNSDANDVIYVLEAARNYDPGPGLKNIKAHVMAVNFEGDLVNATDLDVMKKGFQQIRHGNYIIVPETDKTDGHLSAWHPGLWDIHLETFLRQLN